MTRADWYTQKHSGGWRTARINRRCDQVDQFGWRCTNVTLAGNQYFDTNARNWKSNSHFARIGLCDACANEELK